MSNHKYSPPASTDGAGVGEQTRSPRKSKTLVLLLAAGGVVVVLALALGLGLGLGLHRDQSSSGSTPVSNTNTTANATLSHITPQPASAFVLRGPAMLSEPAQTRTFNFVLEERLGSPDGHEKTMLVVNGQYPGPTIEVNVGDRVVVNVTNLMPNSSAVHWHGLYQRGTPFYDGTNSITQCGIPSGSSLVYNFTLDGWSGTTWYHAHYSTQYTDGITGAFVVHSPNETVPAYDGELLIQVADLYHSFSTDLLRQYLSDSGTINGIGQWGVDPPSYSNYTLLPNSTYRLRLANTGSFAAIRFSVDSHVLTVIEADGTSIVPYEVSGIVIDVAQRYSVLVRTNETAGAYWFRGTIQEDSFTYEEPGFNGNILGVLRYGVDEAAMPNATLADADPGAGASAPGDLDVALLVPADVIAAPNATVFYTLTLSMQNTAGNHWLSFFNSTSWSPVAGAATLFNGLGNTTTGAGVYDNSQFIITVPEVQIVQIVLNNYDDGDHPLHLHGHKMFVMGTGAGRYQGQALNIVNPLRRDTILFKAYSWTVFRFVADNPGAWAFHCHLTWHMSSGLLMQFLTLPAEAEALRPPQVMLDQCKVAGAE